MFKLSLCALAALLSSLAPAAFAGAAPSEMTGEAEKIERGRYLIRIAGCNDCHTANYGMLDGQVPESEWLGGDAFGWHGPWGTTYAPNLRLTMARMSEDAWVVFAKNLQSRPPMPSVNLNHFAEEDLRAIYAFVRTLQPLGDPAPDYVPPGVDPGGLYASFPMPPTD